MLSRPLWLDAYDAQMGLWRWYRTPGALEWLAGLYNEQTDGQPQGFKATMGKLYDAELGRLVECDPFYVSEDMATLIGHARHAFEPEALQEWDLLSPRGFLYYAHPITIRDRNERELEVRAFSWSQQYTPPEGETLEDTKAALDAFIAASEAGEQKYGTRFHSSEMDGMVAAGLLEKHGVIIAVYSDRDTYLETAAVAHAGESERRYVETKERMERITAGTPLVTAHVAPWMYGMTFEGNETDIFGEQTGAREWWQLAQSTFRLMQQRRPHVGYGRPQRAARREWERHGGRPDTEVVIVRLRKEEPPRNRDEEGNGRALTHRHLRSGHWRNQYYPSIKQHKQIYINPTVVGDESLPLQVRPRRVFQWTK